MAETQVRKVGVHAAVRCLATLTFMIVKLDDSASGLGSWYVEELGASASDGPLLVKARRAPTSGIRSRSMRYGRESHMLETSLFMHRTWVGRQTGLRTLREGVRQPEASFCGVERHAFGAKVYSFPLAGSPSACYCT